MTGQAGYTIRPAAYDLGKNLITKPGRSRRYRVPRTIAALLALRDQVHRPDSRRRPQASHRSQTRRLALRGPRLRTLRTDLGITPVTPAA